MEFVGETVVAQGADDGVAGYNLAKGGSSRVALVGRLDVGGEDSTNSRHTLDEQGGDERCLLAYRCDIDFAILLPEVEAQACHDLLFEQAVEFLQRYSDVEVEGVLTYLALAEIAWQEYLACQLYDFFQRSVGGQGHVVEFLMKKSLHALG